MERTPEMEALIEDMRSMMDQKCGVGIGLMMDLETGEHVQVLFFVSNGGILPFARYSTQSELSNLMPVDANGKVINMKTSHDMVRSVLSHLESSDDVSVADALMALIKDFEGGKT